MKLIKEIKKMLSFFTIIPVGLDDDSDLFEGLAKCTPIFPLLGAFIGGISGLIALALSRILPRHLNGFLTLGFLFLITGLHHVDGLLDFGDGLMCKGSPERKIAAMHDRQVGVGGFMLVFIIMSVTALAIAELISIKVPLYLMVSEASAKLAIVYGAWIGKPVGGGMGQKFIEAMRKKRRNLRFLSALAISLTISILTLGVNGVLGVIAGLLSALIVERISIRHFNGLTGDVLGAMNELARMSSLVIMLVISR